MTKQWLLCAALLLALLAGCAAPPNPPQAAASPSPTIAAQAPEATIAPAPVQPVAPAATSAPTAPPVTVAPAPPGQASLENSDAAAFVYQWPAFLPLGMAPAPAESRVARDGEIGDGGVGFYLVTFNDGGRKLVVAGGAVEPFSLSGPIERIRIGDRGARIVTQDNQTLIVIDDGAPGTLFVFGFGLERAELLQVAESLEPVDVRVLRQRAGVE